MDIREKGCFKNRTVEKGGVEMKINTEACYQLAEQKAADYFESLCKQLAQRSYASALTEDMREWKSNHIHNRWLSSLLLRGGRKPDSKDYRAYIKWLNIRGKLDGYLDRSISYLFMRDLGKTLDSPDTQARVRRSVENFKEYLTDFTENKVETFSIARLYRKAQEVGIEFTIIWLINKLKNVSANIPKGMDADHAARKLIKIIFGVVLHEIEEMSDNISPEERTWKLDEAIRLGYSYGLTYPFIDDLLDSKILSDEEQKRYSDLIRTTLVTGVVPELGEWGGSNEKLIRYIHSELREAFEYIKGHQKPEKEEGFLEKAYIFFNSQEVDRRKVLSNPNYTNEELYIPIILKSAYSRLMARSVTGTHEDEGFDNRIFLFGIYNQLSDDFADMFDDLNVDAVTPYTYYLKHHDKRPDIINPFELFWTVISNLIHNVYHSDTKTCEVILDRAINGLKRFKERMGTEKYNQVMAEFSTRSLKFNDLIREIVKKADDVDFLDKLLRDHVMASLKNERREQEDFLDTVKSLQNQINNTLSILKDEDVFLMEAPIIDAANYSLNGDGKRLRPIIAWVMGVDVYGLNEMAVIPLLRSLEYMHTASLIFDDLPSQDNASVRRGRPTLHEVYNTAIAELTGVFLTQKAIEEQASLEQFDAKTVLKLIQYSARTIEDMCKGQAMDLGSKGKSLNLEQLNLMCFYKTGLAFEASLIMPAILANASENEVEALKKFAYHAGIAFQIKDDLLDVDGDSHLLGKATGKDEENNNSTFVSVLGRENAEKEMWEHYCQAIDALQDVQRNTIFLKQLLGYIVNRDH